MIPIQIDVEEVSSNSFVAEFPEANIAASGETHDEAIENLKDMLFGMFRHLSATDNLGKEPKRQLKILESYIGIELK